MPGVKWNISLILLLLCMAATQKQLQSQPQNQPQDQPEGSADSAAYEAWLVGINRRKPVVANARLAMAETVKRGAWDEAKLLLAFMDNRQNNGPWLNGPERLLLLTILTDTATLLNPAALDQMLAETWSVAGSLRPDGVRDRLRYLLRSGAASASDRFDGYRPTEEERRFFNLLLNHLTARGLRAQESLNTLVEQFAAQYPRSRFLPLAQSHIRRQYSEQVGGLGIQAGYGGGVPVGELGNRFGKLHGIAVELEGYLSQFTLSGAVQFLSLAVPAQFVAAGDQWPAGDASMTNATLSLGYELRQGRIAFTPMFGLAAMSVQSGDAIRQQEQAIQTGFGLGFDLSGVADYRIPFDEGPHINVRARVGYSGGALAGYDPTFAGGILYFRLGFGLVYRPYVGRAAGRGEESE